MEHTISTREAEVLQAVGEHLSNAEIAARLFISVRTVESHVSSLLRKLKATDRRALAAVAHTPAPVPLARPRLPAPLTPLVGRAAERGALAEALRAQRLVTAVGPGGVGKTRLALSVLDAVRDEYRDGTWFVDLAAVSDRTSVASVIGTTLGIGGRQARSDEEALLDRLTGRQLLLAVDNCEHLRDTVVMLLERLLTSSPGLTVLATSRSRLRAPFEWVFAVPGLSVDDMDGRRGDAVELFLTRAASAGAAIGQDDLDRVATICRHLDGMPLAVELAAARLPSLGLDGLVAGLTNRLTLLTGAPRLNQRHRSLRSALDWSYHLLDAPEQAVLRRVAIFASRFSADAAADLLVEWAPVQRGSVPDILAALADQSLIVTVAGSYGTRYRVAESIRQYAAEQVRDAGEAREVARRHLSWCLSRATALGSADEPGDAGMWRIELDRIADDVRAALCHDASAAGRRTAFELACRWAELAFMRGWLSESQRSYEQAAGLAADERTAGAALRHAASVAEARHVGDDALVLLRAAAARAARGGDRDGAVRALTRTVELTRRMPGLLTTPPPADAADTALAQAWTFVTDDPGTHARLLLGEAFRSRPEDPLATELAERAAELARRAGDPLAESSALDRLTTAQLAGGELREAAATAYRRLAMLTAVPVTAVSAFEHTDALSMGAECALAVGDLALARHLSEQLRDLPFHAEDGHLANARLLVVETVAGRLAEAVAIAERYRDSWEAAGRPRAANLYRAAHAAATVHGLLGHDAERNEWLALAEATAPGAHINRNNFGEFCNALVHLHHGEPGRIVDTPPDVSRGNCQSAMWLPWYAAVRAEAAVLAGDPDAAGHMEQARLLTRDNRVAAALVERAHGLAVNDRKVVLRSAAPLDTAGCRYQWARTLTLLGGPARACGAAALRSMGAKPAVWPADRVALAEPA